MAGLLEDARTLQAIDALEEVERTGGLYAFDSAHITSAEEFDAHLATYTDLRAATVLFLGQGAVVGVTELHIGDEGADAGLPEVSRALYVDTVGRAQASLREILSIDENSEAYGNFRTFLRYVTAGTVEEAGHQLLAAHLVQANEKGALSDVLVYSDEVGEQLNGHFQQAVETLHAGLSPGQRETAWLNLGYDLGAASRVPLLAATIMPTPREMSGLVDAYYQERQQ